MISYNIGEILQLTYRAGLSSGAVVEDSDGKRLSHTDGVGDLGVGR